MLRRTVFWATLILENAMNTLLKHASLPVFAKPTAVACAVFALAALMPPLAQTAQAADIASTPLTFDSKKYTLLKVTIDGQPMSVRWYKEVCYVTKPILVAPEQTNFGKTSRIENPQCGYQSMNIYVPERALGNQEAAIYLGVNNGGWFASYVKASVADGASLDSAASNVGAALKAGYVYIDLGTRGRGLVAADGSYPGKAPAAVVDVKAAIRYLRLNDAAMPGSAERIVLNGTSGGGALVSIVGASGNSADFLPELAAIGAAGVMPSGKSTLRDDVFAVNAYCPITDLGHADSAYEWLYTALDTRKKLGDNPNPAGSAELAKAYPAYLKSLGLKTSDGQNLTAKNMLMEIQRQVIKSAQAYLDAAPGNTIAPLGQVMHYSDHGRAGQALNDWLEVDHEHKKIVSVNMERYLAFVAQQQKLKSVPAFDSSGVVRRAPLGMPANLPAGIPQGAFAASMPGGMPPANMSPANMPPVTPLAGESDLFGTATQAYSNFTQYSWQHNTDAKDGVGYDNTHLTWQQYLRQPGVAVARQIELINPLHYIKTQASTAPYWYIRHGTRDWDTSFNVSIQLSRALTADSKVKDVNYRLAWDQPHAGNFDVPEAMQWIAQSLRQAPKH
jgi:acetyl esterase/lipase